MKLLQSNRSNHSVVSRPCVLNATAHIHLCCSPVQTFLLGPTLSCVGEAALSGRVHRAGGGHCWVLRFHRCSWSSFSTYRKVLWLSCCLDFSSVPSNFFPIFRDHFSFAICNATFIPQQHIAHQSFLSRALLLLLFLYSFYTQANTHTLVCMCV